VDKLVVVGSLEVVDAAVLAATPDAEAEAETPVLVVLDALPASDTAIVFVWKLVTVAAPTSATGVRSVPILVMLKVVPTPL
jgi:hypothetical protein